jgi:hypothetical protein
MANDMISPCWTIKKISRTRAATHAVPMLMLILLCIAGVPKIPHFNEAQKGRGSQRV